MPIGVLSFGLFSFGATRWPPEVFSDLNIENVYALNEDFKLDTSTWRAPLGRNRIKSCNLLFGFCRLVERHRRVPVPDPVDERPVDILLLPVQIGPRQEFQLLLRRHPECHRRHKEQHRRRGRPDGEVPVAGRAQARRPVGDRPQHSRRQSDAAEARIEIPRGAAATRARIHCSQGFHVSRTPDSIAKQ